jgi:phosphatidylserine/phosphatidylglycerophosphate/cardiolipin synthase-like enzyme
VVSPATATSLDAQRRLLALLATATKEIVLEGESMSDTQIVDALVAAHKAGKKVRIILNDQEGSPAQTTAVATVKAAGIPIVKVATPDIHAKCIVVDRARAYIGSQNFTPTSLLKNREVGVLTQNATEIGKVMAIVDADFAKGVAF